MKAKIESIMKAVKDKELEFHRYGNQSVRKVCVSGIRYIQVIFNREHSIDTYSGDNRVCISIKNTASSYYYLILEFIGFKAEMKLSQLDRWEVHATDDCILIDTGKIDIYLWIRGSDAE